MLHLVKNIAVKFLTKRYILRTYASTSPQPYLNLTSTSPAPNIKKQKRCKTQKNVSQTIDQVSAIKTHTESSKTELFSGTSGHLKVCKFLAVRTILANTLFKAFQLSTRSSPTHFSRLFSCPHGGRGKYFGRTYPRKNDQPLFEESLQTSRDSFGWG